jgi:polyhydroxybutyrate depolymerase
LRQKVLAEQPANQIDITSTQTEYLQNVSRVDFARWQNERFNLGPSLPSVKKIYLRALRVFVVKFNPCSRLVFMRFLALLLVLPLTSLGQQTNGFRTQSIQVQGHTRTYRVFVPANLLDPAPLVFVFHGTESPGHGIDSIVKITRFEQVGQAHHILIIFPEAYEGNWNDGRRNDHARSYRDDIDDIAFVDAILAQTERDYRVDHSRIYATGFSNGAIFCHYLAAQRAHVFAAIAPVSGPIAVPFSAWFHPEFPVSVLEIHGTSDPIVPYTGGKITDDGGETLGAEATVELWARTDRCRRDAAEMPVSARRARDDCYPQGFAWTQGRDGTEVVLYRIIGGGHTWPGSQVGLLSGFFLGRVCMNLDASEVIWNFFWDHPASQKGQPSQEPKEEHPE